jgi:hypothetical protein
MMYSTIFRCDSIDVEFRITARVTARVTATIGTPATSNPSFPYTCHEPLHQRPGQKASEACVRRPTWYAPYTIRDDEQTGHEQVAVNKAHACHVASESCTVIMNRHGEVRAASCELTAAMHTA